MSSKQSNAEQRRFAELVLTRWWRDKYPQLTDAHINASTSETSCNFRYVRVFMKVPGARDALLVSAQVSRAGNIEIETENTSKIEVFLGVARSKPASTHVDENYTQRLKTIVKKFGSKIPDWWVNNEFNTKTEHLYNAVITLKNKHGKSIKIKIVLVGSHDNIAQHLTKNGIIHSDDYVFVVAAKKNDHQLFKAIKTALNRAAKAT